MKKTIIRFLCCLLSLLCAAIPVMAETAAEPAEKAGPEEGTEIQYGEYTFVLQKANWGYYWNVKEYTGSFLPRRSPDERIPKELDGYPVEEADWLALNSDVYQHLNRESGLYRYAPVSETECYLTGYTGSVRLAAIPEELDGYTVVGIADEAFAYSGFTREIFAAVVIFPETMRYVGKYAFSMSSVSYFLLNDSLEVIDDGAFIDICQESLIMPSALKEIGANPFRADYYVIRDNQPLYLTDEQGYYDWSNDHFAVINDALYSLEDGRLIAYLDNMTVDFDDYGFTKWDSVYKVGEGTAIIGENAFQATLSLEKVILPEGVTEIGDDAFACCAKLQEINIPDTVTRIGTDAFHDCASLTAVTIPDSVTEIGTNAFDGYVTITCTAGSAAEAYCKENGIQCIIADP